MKKIIVLLIALVVFTLSACREDENNKYLFGQSENEILTYDRIDYSKKQIMVSRVGNIFLEKNIAEFEKNNPDIQIIYTDITGGMGKYRPWIDYIKNGDGPDVLINSSFDADFASEYFMDLSNKTYVNKYYVSSVDSFNRNGYIYGLPGPSQITGILYNKTLFENNGWEVPKTTEEFIHLCKRINTETDIEAYNPNGKYVVQFMSGLLSFVYSNLISGKQNNQWYIDFINGNNNASFTGHMEPFYEMINDFIECGIIKKEHFTYSATKRGNEFADGNIAMINSPTIFKPQSDKYEFDWFAFPGEEENNDYVQSTESFVISVPKKERSEEINEAIDRFIEYMSSKEAQITYIGESVLISNLKEVSLDLDKFSESFREVVANGRMFSDVMFAFGKKIPAEVSGYPNGVLLSQIQKMIESPDDDNPMELAIEFDKLLNENLSKYVSIQEIYAGEASEDFTILDTSNFIADIFKETTGADIALVLNNTIERGNVLKFYKGLINVELVNLMNFRSITTDSSLVKTQVSGKQLLDILNNPLRNEGLSDGIYAFSGLKATINPWNEYNDRVISVTLENGEVIDTNKLYTIAYWSGTVNDKYITTIPEKYEGSTSELIMKKIKTLKTISPTKDHRITLVWD